jgi:hypothetical protein
VRWRGGEGAGLSARQVEEAAGRSGRGRDSWCDNDPGLVGTGGGGRCRRMSHGSRGKGGGGLVTGDVGHGGLLLGRWFGLA